MNYYLSPRAQDEICEQLIKDFAGLYYSYQPVDIAGFARSIGLTLRYVSFCNEEDEKRLGFYSDGETAVNVMTKEGPRSVTFPAFNILIADELKIDEKKHKRRFTLAHEVYHHLETVFNNGTPIAAYRTEFSMEKKCSVAELKNLMDKRELQADRGAAALLMPRRLVRNTCRSVMEDQPICVYGNDTFDRETQNKLREIADFMQVSMSALIIRLKHLNMLEKHNIKELTGGFFLGGAASDH